jgi:type I restriction enzyme M protein
MFVQPVQFVEQHAGNINNLSVFGQDSNPTAWKLCRMNLAIRGIEANLGKLPPALFLTTCIKLKKWILSSQPALQSFRQGRGQTANRHPLEVRYSPAGNANFAWLRYMIFHLSVKGRWAWYLPMALFQAGQKQ